MNILSSPFKTPQGKANYMATYDAVLAMWPVQPEPLDIPIRFGITHANACGPKDAPSLILLHALSFTSTMWYPNITCLSERFRVYALDTINDIGKSRPTRSLQNRRECAEWLSDVLAELGIEQASFAGVSFGGWLAVNFALNAPDQVKQIVAISPAATFAPIKLHVFLQMLSAFFRTGDSGSIVEQFFIKGFHVDKRLANQFATAMRSGWKAPGWPVMPSVFSDAELRQIKIPMLLLLGENETIYDPKKVLLRSTRLMSSIEATIIPGAKHLLNIEQPELVNSLIMEFLK